MDLQATIRKYNDLTDKEQLRQIIRNNKDKVPQNSENEEYLLQAAAGKKTYVLNHIEYDGEILAAFVIADITDLVYIELILVDPRFTRKHNQQSLGYGTLLLRFVIKDLRDNHGCSRIVLGTDLDNIPANGLFHKFGFTLLMDDHDSNYYELKDAALKEFK